MSADSTDGRFGRDPELQQLNESLTQPEPPDEHTPGENAVEERSMDALLLALDADMLSPTVRRYVTELLRGGENPTPATRQKLVDAAGRSLAYRRANRAALPALLASRRIEAGIEVSELADTLQVPLDEIYQMESGKLNVRDLGAPRITQWVRAVGVEPEVAVSGLRYALQRSATSSAPRAAGRGRTRELSNEDQQLIYSVTALLAS